MTSTGHRLSDNPQPTILSGTPQPKTTRVFDWWNLIAFLAVASLYVRAIFFTPTELRQGDAQKIFYVHPPAAFAAYVAYFLGAGMSVVYLWLRDSRADRLARCAVEVAVLFNAVVVITGPLWAKPIWGVWWAWEDPRLTFTLFLLFIGFAYLVLRTAIEDTRMRARLSAVLAILGSLLIPFIHLTVYLFRSAHPMPIVWKPSAPSLPREMLITFIWAQLAFLALCASFVRSRYRVECQREEVDIARERV